MIKTFLMVLAVIAFMILLIGLAFGTAFLVYWVVLWAGAPKYVAVLAGIAVFFIGGWVTNLKNK